MKTIVMAVSIGASALVLINSAHAADTPKPLQGVPAFVASEPLYLNGRRASAEDREINERIVSALSKSERLRGQTIGVETVGGVVRLSGQVDIVPQIYEAVSIARKVPGVRRVNDDALM